MIKETIPNTVLMNIIISLSFLSKDRFQVARNECKFYDRITEFVEFYSNAKTSINNLFQRTKIQKLIRKISLICALICFFTKTLTLIKSIKKLI